MIRLRMGRAGLIIRKFQRGKSRPIEIDDEQNIPTNSNSFKNIIIKSQVPPSATVVANEKTFNATNLQLMLNSTTSFAHHFPLKPEHDQ